MIGMVFKTAEESVFNKLLIFTEGIPTATNPEKAITTRNTKALFILDMTFDVPNARVPDYSSPNR
jgi:hypothetical protein